MNTAFRTVLFGKSSERNATWSKVLESLYRKVCSLASLSVDVDFFLFGHSLRVASLILLRRGVLYAIHDCNQDKQRFPSTRSALLILFCTAREHQSRLILPVPALTDVVHSRTGIGYNQSRVSAWRQGCTGP